VLVDANAIYNFVACIWLSPLIWRHLKPTVKAEMTGGHVCPPLWLGASLSVKRKVQYASKVQRVIAADEPVTSEAVLAVTTRFQHPL
jgi:hypothetical protein